MYRLYSAILAIKALLLQRAALFSQHLILLKDAPTCFVLKLI